MDFYVSSFALFYIILNTPGTIDSGYRGEVKVILYYTSDEDFLINIEDRAAQMAIRKVPLIQFEEVTELEKATRGSGGFGSTGKTAN